MSLTTISHLCSPLVDVFPARSETKRFKVHRTLVTERCPYFAEHFRKHPEETQIHIEDLSSKALVIVLDYIYTLGVGEIISEGHRYADKHYVNAYVTADAWAMEGLKNLLFDRLREYYLERLPSPIAFQIFMKRDISGSSLEKYMFEVSAHYLCTFKDQPLEELSLSDLIKKGGHQVTMLFDLIRQMQGKPKDPYDDDKCTWHTHEATPACANFLNNHNDDHDHGSIIGHESRKRRREELEPTDEASHSKASTMERLGYNQKVQELMDQALAEGNRHSGRQVSKILLGVSRGGETRDKSSDRQEEEDIEVDNNDDDHNTSDEEAAQLQSQLIQHYQASPLPLGSEGSHTENGVELTPKATRRQAITVLPSTPISQCPAPLSSEPPPPPRPSTSAGRDTLRRSSKSTASSVTAVPHPTKRSTHSEDISSSSSSGNSESNSSNRYSISTPLALSTIAQGKQPCYGIPVNGRDEDEDECSSDGENEIIYRAPSLGKESQGSTKSLRFSSSRGVETMHDKDKGREC